jgi:citrate lyase beta subunit
MAKSLCLLALPPGIAAIDTLYANFKDPEEAAPDSRPPGAPAFSGRIAIHPDQSEIINTRSHPTRTRWRSLAAWWMLSRPQAAPALCSSTARCWTVRT